MKYTDRPLDPVLVDIGKRDQDFVLYYGDRPLQTASGREYSHESERLLRNILLEIIETGAVKLEEISVTLFFEIQKDLVEKGRDHVQKNLDALIGVDPFIAMKASGKGMMHALPKDGGDGNPPVYGDNLMAGFWRVSSLMGPLNEEIGRMIGRMEVTEPVDQPVPYLVRAAYAERTHAEKAVLQVLCYSHRAGIVLPLMWMLGVINASEYARGLELVRTAGLLDGICEHADLARVPFVSKGSGTLPAAEGKMNGVLLDLSRASDYLALMKGASPAGRDIRSLIAAGESATLEFKSTLRWDLRAGKTSPAIERASLKTISAFLNTNGGILLIGVRDDGTVEGIESDRLANGDKFLLHFWTLIRTCFGREVTPYLRTELKTEEEGTVCMVTCMRCDHPVFLSQPGFPEEFYIRTGPGSNALTVREALKYIGERFPSTS